MVGIDRGLLSQKAKIRLGDTILSQPINTFRGAIPYDAGFESVRWSIQMDRDMSTTTTDSASRFCHTTRPTSN